MNNLTEKKIEFNVNLKFDESFFDENLNKRMRILTNEVRTLHHAFNYVE